jgi:hypothetical protein
MLSNWTGAAAKVSWLKGSVSDAGSIGARAEIKRRFVRTAGIARNHAMPGSVLESKLDLELLTIHWTVAMM